MSIDYVGGSRPSKNYRLDRVGTMPNPGPYVGVVMDTIDPAHLGRIRVWIKTFGDPATKQEESSWFTVRYMTPFYGVTPHKTGQYASEDDFEENGHSYGMWFNVPDIGVEVLVVFAEGDPNQGYYIGCIPALQMTHMVPAIGSQANPHYNNDEQQSKCGHAPRLPVTEINRKDESLRDSSFTEIPKPVHSVIAGQMWKQGILTDQVRGPISSSAQRESPSCVYGVSTPGRSIIEDGLFGETGIKGRRGGHSFVMDDGDADGNDNLVRIRTSAGHQITMSDNGKSIFIIHSNGNSWVELGAEGTIDMYAANSINLRTHGDINFHAEKNVNINGEKVNVRSTKDITLEAEVNLSMSGFKSVTAFSKSKVGIKSDGTIGVDAGSSASMKAGGNVTIKGAKIGLNDGSPISVTAPKAMSLVDFPDVIKDTTLGWVSADGKFKSVVTRAPTHEPYDAHNAGISSVKPFE